VVNGMHDTFVHQFVDQMRHSPGKLAMVCVEDDGAERQITRSQFLAAVQTQARSLLSQGVKPGDIALLALPHGMDLFAAFWGVLFLGGIPIVFNYPNSPQDKYAYFDQVKTFSDQTQNQAVLVSPENYLDLIYLFDSSKMKVIQTRVTEPRRGEASIEPVRVPSLETTAILQFSSGTTGAKKGVMLSFRAIMNYLGAIQVYMQITPDDVMVSWLPLSHDMGLIASFILPLTSGFPTVILSPRAWISKPSRLFGLVHKYKGTISLMPNFAFSYCAKSVTDKQMEGLDLSSWRLVINGAEMVRSENLVSFSKRFGPYGLPQTALSVGYGMAECVLGVSRTPLGEHPKVDWVDRDSLSNHGKALACPANAPNGKAVVSCGRPHPNVEILIVDQAGQPLPEREVGEIRVRNTTLFSGYHLQPELTRQRLLDGWFRTGDLGYTCGGELYVCGRESDVIITFGKKVYPEDIEAIAESFPQVRKGRTAAFGVEDERSGSELVVLVCELVDPVRQGAQDQLVKEISAEVLRQLGVMVSVVRFEGKGWVVKTTSGKVARAGNREKYLRD
jgi:fatty-acyl-CoA synthase